MTKRHLLLLRHAKASREDPSGNDMLRPLTDRGRRAAQAMGGAIEREGLLPDLVLCSPATRAQETWELVRQEWDKVPDWRTVPGLYDFGDGTALLNVIRHEAEGSSSLMLVGHNPAFEVLAQRLAGSGNGKLFQTLEEKFPTAALAVLAFEGDWNGLQDGSARLTHFIRPRDLA